MMDGSCGVDEVRCETLLAHFSFLSLLRPNEDERERRLNSLCLCVSSPLRLGSVVSQMPGTNPLALPYLSYCRRHLSQCHSGGM